MRLEKLHKKLRSRMNPAFNLKEAQSSETLYLFSMNISNAFPRKGG